jgi:hypothetical protein
MRPASATIHIAVLKRDDDFAIFLLCRKLVDAHRHSFGLGREDVPRAVTMLEEENLCRALWPNRRNSQTASPVHAGPREPGDPDLRRRIWCKPFFDQQA